MKYLQPKKLLTRGFPKSPSLENGKSLCFVGFNTCRPNFLTSSSFINLNGFYTTSLDWRVICLWFRSVVSVGQRTSQKSIPKILTIGCNDLQDLQRQPNTGVTSPRLLKSTVCSASLFIPHKRWTTPENSKKPIDSENPKKNRSKWGYPQIINLWWDFPRVIPMNSWLKNGGFRYVIGLPSSSTWDFPCQPAIPTRWCPP